MREKKIAISMMILSSLAFAVMGLFVKMVTDVPAIQKAVFRTITVMIISFIILKKNTEKTPKIHNLKWLIFRSFFGTVGIVLNYYALSHLMLSDASIIFRLSSILVLLFSFVFLKEKLDKEHVIPIIIAFIGVGFIVRPSFSSSFLDYGLAFIGACGASLAYMSLRVLGKTENSHMVVFFFSAFSTVVLLPVVLFNFKAMSVQDMLLLTMAGIFAAIGQYGVTFAYKYAKAKEVSIYNYSGVVFSGILELIFFGLLPDYFSLIGYVIIFASSYMIYKITIQE